MNDLTTYEAQLLEGWEGVAKKGQLSLWILLSLKDGAKHMAEIKAFIGEATNQTVVADDQSMYRALRRYDKAELIHFHTQSGDGGPDRKIYALTPTGERVLHAYLNRNIVKVLYKPEVKRLIERN